ncbi:MAG: U32 family peptidase [Clostridia bacterium]|nr:U32 family peptidase [Clostridia bacterium]
MMNKIELMAPAGNLEILKAAVDYGADAVYLGVGAFNARMNADNFGFDELQEGIRYAKLRSSKVYLTLNTIVNSFELDEAVITAGNAYDLGIDGLIIQDLGLAIKIHEQYPNIPLIASTQMNIFSTGEFSKLKELGFKRIVFPRELSLDEISKRNKIASRLGLETEVFAHGAVCVCASGLCLFSSMNKSGSRSGNRGLCAQPCRQEYTLYKQNTEIKQGHLISPKDRSIIPYLSQIIESGTTSLKIEGRMRDINYVKSTVRAYRILIDAFYEGTLDDRLADSVMNDLLVNFNRGGKFTTQYLNGKKPSDFLSGEYVGKFGLKLGIIRSCDSSKGTITFTYNDKLPLPSRGDYLSIRSGSDEVCSFPIGKIHEMPKALAVKGLHPEMILKLKENMSVYLMGHDTVIDRTELRKTHINISVDNSNSRVISANAKVITGSNREVFAEYEIDIDEGFEGNALAPERVEAQLRKCGDTPFTVDEVYFVSDNEFKCKISIINELRRGLTDNLCSEILFSNENYLNPDFEDFFDFDENSGIAEQVDENENGISGDILNMVYFPSYKNVTADLLNTACDLFAFNIYDLCVKKFRDEIINLINGSDKKLVVVFPDFHHDLVIKVFLESYNMIKDALGEKLFAYIDSKLIGTSEFASEDGVKHFVSAGANIFNEVSSKFAFEQCDGIYPSYELQKDEMTDTILKSGKQTDKYVLLHTEGRIPWMQSDFCSIGAHQPKCRACFDPVDYILKPDENARNDQSGLYVFSRPVDCSSSIWGDAKNKYNIEDAERLSEAGYNVINVNVII